MSTLITLNLANAEVFHLFKRKTKKGAFFMTEVTQKITSLMRQVKALDVHALLALDYIQQQLIDFTQRCYDDIDKFDAMLEKKKHLQNKTIRYQSQFFPEIAFENQISNHLIELFERYDGVISRLKTLRNAGCFQNDNDYFANLRRHQRAVNQLLSELMLTPIKNSDPLRAASFKPSSRALQKRFRHLATVFGLVSRASAI